MKKKIDKYSRTYSDNNFDDNIKLLEQLRDIQIAVTEKKKILDLMNLSLII